MRVKTPSSSSSSLFTASASFLLLLLLLLLRIRCLGRSTMIKPSGRPKGATVPGDTLEILVATEIHRLAWRFRRCALKTKDNSRAL